MSWHRALATSAAYRRGVPIYTEAGPILTFARHASTSRKAATAPRERVELKPAASRTQPAAKTARNSGTAVPSPARTARPALPVKEYTEASESRPQSKATSSPALDQEWGWQKADYQPEGWLVEQRTLFARPNELLWGEKIRYAQFAYIFAAVIIANVLAWPDPEKIEQARADFIARQAVAEARGGFTPEELEAEQEELMNRVGRMRRIWDNVTDTMDPKRYAIIGAVGLGVFVLHRMVSRNVLEIRQIRRTRKPSSTELQQASAEVQNKVRVATSLRDVKLPLVRGVQEYDLKDTGVINLPSGKTTLLGFRAGKHHDYRMDMTVTDKLRAAVENPAPKAPDVVVSMSRLERVWKLENPAPKRAFWAPISDWFERAAEARSAGKK